MKHGKTLKTVKYKGFIIKVKHNECWVYGDLGPFPPQWAVDLKDAKHLVSFLKGEVVL